MKYISVIFLAAFTLWGVSVVNRDIASRKITNSSLKNGLKLWALMLCALSLYTWMGYTGREQSFLNINFYIFLFRHVAWSILAAIALWYAEVWPAGDAKFFMVVAAGLPLINPYIHDFPDYLFLSLLINIFVAAALWAMGNFLASGFYSASPSDFFSELWDDLKKRLASLGGGKKGALAGLMLLNMVFLFLLHQIMSMEFRGFLARFFGRTDMLFFFLFILWDKIGEVFTSKKWVYVGAAGSLLYFGAGLFLYPERLWVVAWAAMLNVVKFSLLLFFGRYMLEFLMEKKDLQYIGPEALETGIILSSKSARILKQNTAFEGMFDDCFKDGLTEEQVEALKGWMKKLEVKDPKLEVVTGRPFALWVFAGAVITLLFNKNLAGFLR